MPSQHEDHAVSLAMSIHWGPTRCTSYSTLNKHVLTSPCNVLCCTLFTQFHLHAVSIHQGPTHRTTAH